MVNVVVTTVFIVFYTIFQIGQCYSTGAPISQCTSMTPNHDGVTAQSGRSPYTIKTEKPYYMLGENVNVSIESSGDDIKGYLIQARQVGTEVATGMFATLPLTGKYVPCGNEKGAVTHSMRLSVKTATFEWEPPSNFSGNISFYATIVKDRITFWVKLMSPELYKKEVQPKLQIKPSTPVTNFSPSPSVSLSRTTPVINSALRSSLLSSRTTTVTIRILSSSPSAFSSCTTPVTNSFQSPRIWLSRKTPVINSTSSPSVSSSRTTLVANSSPSSGVSLSHTALVMHSTSRPIASSSRTTPVTNSFQSPRVWMSRTTPVINSASSPSVSSSRTTPVANSSPSSGVSLSHTALVMHSNSRPIASSSRTTPVANSSSSPRVSFLRKTLVINSTSINSINSSPSVSPSPQQEDNMSKVNDPKCDGAQLNYNVGLLYLFGFIACILAKYDLNL